jgi:hypothetical protein
MFHTGGNPDEGKICDRISKVLASPLELRLSMKCPYEGDCDISFSYAGVYLADTLSGPCFSGYELKLATDDSLSIVRSLKSYPIHLSPNNHIRFSLIDEDGVEKKYDIDLSGIIHSFTVRGDSVDVNVMKDCSFKLYSCKKETVYGNNLLNGKYTFSVADGCDSETSYRCSWHNQSSLGTDDLDIDATIYWK